MHITRKNADISKESKKVLGLYPFSFSFSCFFFYESQALHRKACYFLVTLLVLHMLFFGVFASNYALFWGGQTSKNAFNRQLRYFMVVSVIHSSVVCCLLFAVCDKWVDFRGGDAVQQCCCCCCCCLHIKNRSDLYPVPFSFLLFKAKKRISVVTR